MLQCHRVINRRRCVSFGNAMFKGTEEKLGKIYRDAAPFRQVSMLAHAGYRGHHVLLQQSLKINKMIAEAETLGRRLRELRLAKNWTQEELAEFAGITSTYTSDLER